MATPQVAPCAVRRALRARRSRTISLDADNAGSVHLRVLTNFSSRVADEFGASRAAAECSADCFQHTTLSRQRALTVQCRRGQYAHDTACPTRAMHGMMPVSLAVHVSRRVTIRADRSATYNLFSYFTQDARVCEHFLPNWEQANDTNEDSCVHRVSDLRRCCAGRSRHNLKRAEVVADANTICRVALVANAPGKASRASTAARPVATSDGSTG